MVNLHHFYHIYASGQWLEPAREHFTALKAYGLHMSLETFYIGIVGAEHERAAVRTWLDDQMIGYRIIAVADTGWEQVTQIPMWEFCKKHDGLMLYAHTKGASDPSDVNIRWRRSMTYWNVVRWRDAVEKLNDHDLYGCHWIQPLIDLMPEHVKGNWMMAGTFFWAYCSLLARFPRPALTHRHEAEGFLGYGYAEKPFRVYDPTPYFPNTAPFADGWIGNPNYEPEYYPAKTY